MTDVKKLAEQLYRKINQQNVPDEVDKDDLVFLIKEAIEHLYVISGRTFLYSEDKFTLDDYDVPESFADDLELDERQYVVQRAQIEFFKWVQASVDDQTSYTTDAMSVTHGDKPYEHIGQTIDRLEKELALTWSRMVRYNQLGVSG